METINQPNPLLLNEAFRGQAVVQNAATLMEISEKLKNPQTIALGTSILAGVGNSLQLGKKERGLAKQEAFSFNGMASGASLGASIGSVVPGLGTVVGGAIGAVGGLAVDAVKFHNNKQQFKANSYIQNMLAKQNNQDTTNMDYTGLSI